MTKKKIEVSINRIKKNKKNANNLNKFSTIRDKFSHFNNVKALNLSSK